MTLEKFMDRITPEPNSGCWLWMGAINESGYGQWRGQMAHRFSYEAIIAPIPDGLTIDHLCRVRCCVNPAHLEPVTMRENVMRGFGPTADNARKTHCKNGHEFTPENTRLRVRKGHTRRECKICQRAIDLAWQKQFQKPRRKKNG